GVVERAAPGGDHARQGRIAAVAGRPVQAVAPAVLAARGQRRRRPPGGHDVVGELVGRRQLDQVDLARAPGPERLHPAARALLVGRLQVLVVLEAALALHQREAARIAVLEAAVLDRARVAQWTPRLSAG